MAESPDFKKLLRAFDEKQVDMERGESSRRAFARLRKLQRRLPAGFLFDRAEAHAR